MPELPEVETIRRVLEPQLQNRTIEKVTVNHKDAVAYPSVDDFCLGLTGQMVSQGTTPRRLTDLIGSLCDLTSGSGDKGTPIVLVQGYFDNYTK